MWLNSDKVGGHTALFEMDEWEASSLQDLLEDLGDDLPLDRIVEIRVEVRE